MRRERSDQAAASRSCSSHCARGGQTKSRAMSFKKSFSIVGSTGGLRGDSPGGCWGDRRHVRTSST
eukprot:7059564-Alexandrium_andersonii.AAC.1